MTKRTVLRAEDPVVSGRIQAAPVIVDHPLNIGNSEFMTAAKVLGAITAVALVVSIFVPAVLGIAVFTGLLAVLGFGAAFLQTVKFDNQYDARAALDIGPRGRYNPISPFFHSKR